MANARREYLKKHKHRMKELKISYTGIASVVCALISIGVSVTAIVYAFIYRGEGDIMTACFGLLGLVFSIGSILLGLLSFKEPQVRLRPARIGTIAGVIMTIALMAFYLSGVVA